MNGPEKSDLLIVPGKRPNRPGRSGAEAVEGRGGAEGTAGRQSTVRTLSRDAVSQALARVREVAKRNKRERFTALMHHITPDMLAWAFHRLKPKAAPGVDGVTWDEYAASLDANIGDLHRRVVRGAAAQAAIASGVNHTVRLPRARRAASYSAQLVTRCRCLGM